MRLYVLMATLLFAFLVYTSSAVVPTFLSNLFLFSSSPPSSFGCVITGVMGTAEGCINASISMAIIGILLSFALVAFAYMLGEIIKIDKLRGWYVGELWESIKSILIIGTVFSVLIILSGIALTLAGGTAVNSSHAQALSTNLNGLWSVAYNQYIMKIGLKTSETATDAILGLAMGVGALSSINFELSDLIGIGVPFLGHIALSSGSSGSLYTSTILDSSTGYSFLSSLATIVTTPIEILFVFLWGFFYDIVGIGIAVFLPIGIVLRAIPLLRGLGGTFIAIGIGLFLVFPTLLVVLNLPVTNYVNSMVYANPPQQTITKYPTSTLNFIQITAEKLFSIEKGILGGYLTFYAGTFVGYFSSMFGIYSVLNYATYYTLLDVLQFLLFLIDILFTFVISNNIANLLGGQIKLGVGKFKIA